MVFDEVVAYVTAALPAPPARVLEVGAGDGELTRALRARGYDVVAIDPASQEPDVVPVALEHLEAAPASFEAAVAVLSLHHVTPLGVSCRRLADALCSGAPLVIDEFDVERLNDDAARWWIAQRRAAGAEVPHAADSMTADLCRHLHSLADVRRALEDSFTFGEPVRGSYLYRWGLPAAMRGAEEAEIAAARIPATGARFIALRR